MRTRWGKPRCKGEKVCSLLAVEKPRQKQVNTGESLEREQSKKNCKGGTIDFTNGQSINDITLRAAQDKIPTGDQVNTEGVDLTTSENCILY